MAKTRRCGSHRSAATQDLRITTTALSCGICASIDPRIDMRLAPNGHLRPHLHPQRYELRNWYMDGVLRRHAALVRGGEDHYAYEDDKAELEALWNKVAPPPTRACPRTRPRRARRLTRSGRGRCMTR